MIGWPIGAKWIPFGPDTLLALSVGIDVLIAQINKDNTDTDRGQKIGQDLNRFGITGVS